jgi:hypothetical protein
MKDKVVHIKHKIARWLLADEVAKVDMEREAFITMQGRYERLIKDFSAQTENYTIQDLTRENLKGLDTRTLLNEDGLIDMMDDEELDGFLAKAKDLDRNHVFKKICAYIKRTQIQQTVLAAGNMNEVNFGRATINGVSLVEDMLASLLILYEERHSEEGEYDKHSI